MTGVGDVEKPRGMEPYGVELRGLRKSFGDVVATDNVDLAVENGELVTLLGPSGSGKTTILRMIAGYETPSGGAILIEGVDVSRHAPWRRTIGVVAQQYALFPHLSVGHNIEYGLKNRGWRRSARRERVAEMLELVQLAGYEGRFPWQLSGGQQQRVALARAIAFSPSLLVMDEPLGALDRSLRFQMAEEIRRVHRELGTTIIYVTHDREEALALSDRVAVMRDGRILEVSHPEILFNCPRTAFVAKFFGDANLLPLGLVRVLRDGRGVLKRQGLDVSLDDTRIGDDFEVAILPHHFVLNSTGNDLHVKGQLLDTLFFGDALQLTCLVQGHRIVARVPPLGAGVPRVGQSIDLFVPWPNTVLVERN